MFFNFFHHHYYHHFHLHLSHSHSRRMTSVSGKPTSTGDGVSFLKSKTSVLGQKLYVIILITVVIVTAILFLLLLFFVYRHKSKRRRNSSFHIKHIPTTLLPSSSPLTSINVEYTKNVNQTQLQDERVVANKTLLSMFELDQNESPTAEKIDSGKMESDGSGSGSGTGSSEVVSSSSMVSVAESSGICCWGRWFSMNEIETATNGFATENVIGEGGYGVVYRGVLQDGSSVAVKNLFDIRGQAEKEFKVEVEAIGKVRHKNLVGLIGFCAEGAKRLLVYELVDNGNLEQWLHGDVGPTSPLTWDMRMKIAVGTAKGLAYLHEGLEPKVVHRDVKSSNILLDKRWNAKVADFGLAKLLDSEKSYVTTRVMGTFGYVSPDYASTGMLNEGSDVYSFGVLLMELVTGRSPVDYSRPPGEMNLVDWFKGMVASRRGEELLDPKIALLPSPRALKRALLVCLRCIDMDASKRPKMGQVIHMLEADEFPFRGESRPHRDTSIPRPGVPVVTKVPFPTAGDKQR